MSSKYNIGDKVRIRSDLVEDVDYNQCCFVRSMRFFLGKVVTIKSTRAKSNQSISDGDNYYYYFDEDSDKWSWVDEMFDDMTDYSVDL
jgi:hypothetical protein